jgi:LPXTG-motif cell wall-anchored protein
VRPEVVDRLHDLTGPLVAGVTNLVHGKVQQLVASPQFVAAWNRALQVAHDQANAVLSGESSAIGIKNGMVVLDLNPFIEAAKQQLVASGFTAAAKIPDVHPTVDLAPATGLIRAQTAYQMLDAVASWLPWITLLLLAAGVYLARRRRRALLGVGLGVVTGMLVLAVALLIGRAMLVNAVPEQGAAAAAALYDILVRFLRIALRTLAVLGLVIALGAYLVGPAAGAVQIRGALGRGIGALRRGRVAEALAAGPVGPWVHAHRQLLRVAVLGLAVLVFVLLDRPTGWDVLLVAVGLVLALGIIEFLDQPPVPAPPVETIGAENLPVPADGASRAAEHGSAPPVPAQRG